MTRIVIALVSVSAFAACLPELPAPKAAPASAPTTESAAIPSDDAAPAAYAYSPAGKRDAFQSPTTTSAPAPKAAQVLQRYELDELTLAFTTTGSATPTALLIDPKGKSHLVQIGDLVGKQWGKVTRIGHDELEVTTLITNAVTGLASPSVATLRMSASAALAEEPDMDVRLAQAQ